MFVSRMPEWMRIFRFEYEYDLCNLRPAISPDRLVFPATLVYALAEERFDLPVPFYAKI